MSKRKHRPIIAGPKLPIDTTMASSKPPSSAGGVQSPSFRKSLGFLANAIKGREGFLQILAMSGILLLSGRSLVQKVRIHDLTEGIAELKEEEESLTSRMNRIRESLLTEAALEPTGSFSARLSFVFGDDSN